mmetsp:Transcript_25935/g.61511  ORF Transcript_25935/g.61511 Transcript_25935/m.61511 type:complete len:374 (-) Transcript_25935:131-1252(-)
MRVLSESSGKSRVENGGEEAAVPDDMDAAREERHAQRHKPLDVALLNLRLFEHGALVLQLLLGQRPVLPQHLLDLLRRFPPPQHLVHARLSISVFGVDVGAILDQHLRHGVVPVQRRQVQRRVALVSGQIDVSLACNERLAHLNPPPDGSDVQRRVPFHPRLYLSAGSDEDCDDARVAACSSDVQRRVAPASVTRVDLRLGLHEKLRHLLAAACCCEVQWRRSRSSESIDVAAAVDQRTRHLHSPPLHRDVQRRRPLQVSHVAVRSALDELGGALCVFLVRCVVQWCRTVLGLRHVGIGSSFDEGFSHLDVSAQHSMVQSCRALNVDTVDFRALVEQKFSLLQITKSTCFQKGLFSLHTLLEHLIKFRQILRF